MTACSSTSTTSKTNKKKEQDLAKLKFGIEVADLNDNNSGNSKLSHGVVVEIVYGFYPANKAGIVKGDIIVSLNDKTIFDEAGFKQLLETYKYTYGQVTLGISRNNKIEKIKVYLE